MKLQVFGFAFIVAAAVAGVDYSMQAKQVDQTLGLTGYVDTITGRFDQASEARALKARQKAEVKIHLPEALDGWVRSEWDAADTTSLEAMEMERSSFQRAGLTALELAPMMGGMVATKVQLAAKMRRTTIWVYERGDEMIALRVIYTKTGAVTRFPGLDGKINKLNAKGINSAAPYAFVQGVGFGEVRVDHALTGPVGYRAFAASMGSNVTIGVRAVASDASIKAMMEAIDYDGLNGMLDTPLANVGKDAPQVSPAEAMVMAEQALEARRAALRGDEPVAVEVTTEVQKADAPDEVIAEVVAEEAPPEGIKVGLNAVSGLPGQKCERKKGILFCGFATE